MLSAAKERTLSAFGDVEAILASAALARLNENSRPGDIRKNPALHQCFELRNSTTALGLRGSLLGNRIRSRCTGKEHDPETNNDYFGARYYGSVFGRFLTPDWSATPSPIPYASMGLPQTLNLYSYVQNNPITGIDPDGHCLEDACIVELTLGFAIRQLLVTYGPAIIAGAAIGGGAAYADAKGWVNHAITVVSVPMPGISAGADPLPGLYQASANSNEKGAAPPARVPSGQSTPADPQKPDSSSGNNDSKKYKPGADFSKGTKKATTDKNDNTCQYCGDKTTPSKQSQKDVPRDPKEGTTDHYDPKSNGGTNDPANARHACLECNQKKGSMPPEDWEQQQK